MYKIISRDMMACLAEAKTREEAEKMIERFEQFDRLTQIYHNNNYLIVEEGEEDGERVAEKDD